MADDETPVVQYNETRSVRSGVLVRYKFIYPANPERYPPGACYSLHYGVDPALAPDDVSWPVGDEQGTMVRYLENRRFFDDSSKRLAVSRR